MTKKTIIFLLGFVLVSLLGITSKIESKQIRFSNEKFTITYPHSWALTVLSDTTISIVHHSTSSEATDVIYDTDFASLTIKIIPKNELKKHLTDRVLTDIEEPPDTVQSKVQSVEKKTVKIKNKSVPFYYWTTELQNGVDSYLPYDDKHVVFFTMFYGNHKRRYFEKAFFRVVASYMIR